MSSVCLQELQVQELLPLPELLLLLLLQLLLSGSVPFEFRTTVVAELHDDDSFHGIGAWIRGAERYYLQPFTDRETVPFQGFHTPEKERLNAWREIMRRYVPEAEIRGQA